MKTQRKKAQLAEYLTSLDSIVIAFSGGVDSTFLLKVAHDLLGSRVLAVTLRSNLFPKREIKDAELYCRQEGIAHLICDFQELEITGFAQNPENRCYLCKKKLFSIIWGIAREKGFRHVADGSNLDDDKDYRPGLTAIVEKGVKSPLLYAKLSKQEIRNLSKEMGLFTWDKPSFACLASRFPYGEIITTERLLMIDRAEQILLDLGLRQVRVRYHGGLARIETDEKGFILFQDKGLRKTVYEQFERLGFTYISLDLMGYRTGSMNETLKSKT
ncbi:MAG: ATP-dependent sacrificial sulfur transferase LarE [Bacillota bacterium]|jgi:uncharacterized protein